MHSDQDHVTGAVLDASIKLHREFGPGMLESVYEQVLAASLIRRGFNIARQSPIDIRHDGLIIPGAFRADLLVENVIVELKCVERLARVHERQLLTYMRLGGFGLGLLVNFGGATLKEGFRRYVL